MKSCNETQMLLDGIRQLLLKIHAHGTHDLRPLKRTILTPVQKRWYHFGVHPKDRKHVQVYGYTDLYNREDGMWAMLWTNRHDGHNYSGAYSNEL